MIKKSCYRHKINCLSVLLLIGHVSACTPIVTPATAGVTIGVPTIKAAATSELIAIFTPKPTMTTEKVFFDKTTIISYDLSKWVKYPYDLHLSGYIHQITSDKTGVLWGTSEKGVFRIKDDGFNLYTIRDGLASDDTFAIAVDRTDHIWVGSGHGGKISSFDGQSWKIVYDDKNIGINISSIFTTRNGTVWFAASKNKSSANGYILQFDGYTWRKFTKEDGLQGNSFGGIVEDFDGNIWVAAHEGLSQFDQKKWTFYPFPSTVDYGSGLFIVDADSSLLYLKYKEIYRYKKQQWTEEQWNNVLYPPIISFIKTRDGKIWFGMLAGSPYPLVMFDKNVYWVFDNLPFDTILDMAEDANNKLWLSTNQGIYIYTK